MEARSKVHVQMFENNEKLEKKKHTNQLAEHKKSCVQESQE